MFCSQFDTTLTLILSTMVIGRYTTEFQWQMEKQSLSFFLGPRLISTAPVSIKKRMQSHESTIWKLFNNRKIRIQNFVVSFKTLPSTKTRQKKKRSKIVVKNKLKHIWTNVLTFPHWELLTLQFYIYFSVVKNLFCPSILRLTGIFKN